MDELDLSGNELGDEEMVYLSKCIHKVKQLVIIVCHIKSNGMKNLSDVIRTLKKPVRILLNVLESLNYYLKIIN